MQLQVLHIPRRCSIVVINFVGQWSYVVVVYVAAGCPTIRALSLGDCLLPLLWIAVRIVQWPGQVALE